MRYYEVKDAVEDVDLDALGYEVGDDGVGGWFGMIPSIAFGEIATEVLVAVVKLNAGGVDGGLDVGAVKVGNVSVVRVKISAAVLVDVVGLEIAAGVVVVVCCVVRVADAVAGSVIHDVGEAFGGVGAAFEVAAQGVVAGWWRWGIAFEVRAGRVAGDVDGAGGGICDLIPDSTEAAVFVTLFEHIIHVTVPVAVRIVGV